MTLRESIQIFKTFINGGADEMASQTLPTLQNIVKNDLSGFKLIGIYHESTTVTLPAGTYVFTAGGGGGAGAGDVNVKSGDGGSSSISVQGINISIVGLGGIGGLAIGCTNNGPGGGGAWGNGGNANVLDTGYTYGGSGGIGSKSLFGGEGEDGKIEHISCQSEIPKGQKVVSETHKLTSESTVSIVVGSGGIAPTATSYLKGADGEDGACVIVRILE